MSFPKKGKVLFTATLVRGHIAKFHIPYLKWFKEQGWETWVASKNDYPDGICEIPYCDHFVNIDFARSPFSMHTLSAYKQLRRLFGSEFFDIVHTHTPVGGVLTRLAAREARNAGTKVLYTAHGFHFFDGAPWINWILWYPVECLMTTMTDVLITINSEDYARAKRFSHCRVVHASGVGVDFSKFENMPCRSSVRAELNIKDDSFMVLSIGDLNQNKNHGLLIKTLATLDGDNVLCIAGVGPMKEQLVRMAKEYGVADKVMLLGFRNDIRALLNACDLFCLPSKREGLPVSLIEAAAAGVPCLSSNARGCSDVLGSLSTDCIVDDLTIDSWSKAITKMKKESQLGISERLKRQVMPFELSSVTQEYASVYYSLYS